MQSRTAGSTAIDNRAEDRSMTAPASTSHGTWPAWIVLVAGLSITLLATLYAKTNVEATQRQELVLIGNEFAARIQTRLAANAQVLRDAAAFFAGATEVTRQEWRTFVERSNLQQNLPGIEGIGFVLLIPADVLSEHERLIRAEGFPDYRVWPAGERTFYTSIVFLEPFTGRNLRAFGYDMYSEPIRRTAMDQARDTDRAALTGKVQLVQESDQDIQAGTLMYVPVYRTGLPTHTLEERRAALVGWVYSPYRMNDLMQGVLGERDQKEPLRTRLTIFDGNRLDPQALLFDSQPGTLGHAATATDAHTLELPVDFHGRHWTLLVSRSSVFSSAITDPQVLLLTVSGLVISLLLAALTWALIGSRARATQLAAELEARQRAELALQEQKSLLQAVLDNIPLELWACDTEGRCFMENPILVRQRGSTVGKRLADLAMTADERTRWHDNQTRALAGEVVDAEVELQGPGARRVFQRIVAPIHRNEHIQGILGINIDISERKRFESELQQAREAAESANAAKSEFLAHMSHEIRTPLNVVLGLAQVLNRESLTTNQRDMVERIQAAGESLLGIINDILDLSKIEAGQLRIEQRPFDLWTLLARVESLMGHAAQAKGLSLCIESAAVPRGLLVGDELRLHQVLINLVSNAIKFTHQGEVSLLVQPDEETATALRLRFTVRDSGIGIAPETLSRLFTPFSQAEAGTTRRFGGTGLGLAICKRLVALMGGEIGADSEPEQGSTFWFELPFGRAAAGEVAASPVLQHSTPPVSGPCLTGVHILVVDDSAMNRDLVERALALAGATTTMAGDGQQAVQILQNRPEAFDAVLMDVRMPVMDGLTATRLIRTKLGLTTLPIIALTAGVFAEQQEAARAAGVNEVLAKPLVLENLTNCLLRWVTPKPGPAAGPGQAAGPTHDDQPADAFPEIPGVDRIRAAQALDHKLDIFIQLLRRFAETFRDAVALTRRDLATGERETAARRIHTLRGNAGTLGALDLMASATALEQAIDRGETELDERLKACDRQIADLIEASRPWREPAEAPGPASGEAPPLEAHQLKALREDLRLHNMKALRRFKELQPALRGALGQAPTEALGRAIQDIDFERALEILNRSTR
jgi:PAS domain S-box-containing protein